MTAIESEARSPGITYQELLDQDTHPVPEVLRLESARYLGSADVPVTRYTSRAYHRREVARLWRRVWQFACREEHIPEPGDYIVYDIAELSFFVIRGADGAIRAFPNACLHRGRKLKDLRRSLHRGPLPVPRLRLDARRGAGDVPAGWDFPHVDTGDDSTCPSARSPHGPGSCSSTPIRRRRRSRSSSASSPEHFAVWDLEDRYVEAHVAKVIAANWKVTQEAFCEAFHVNATHPQILPYLGDTNAQVDVWESSPGWSRPSARRARCSAGIRRRTTSCARCSTCAGPGRCP